LSVAITTACVTCGACLWECPTEAIRPGDPRPVVDEDMCTECYGFFGESQCVVVCPAGAVLAIPEAPENLARKFAKLRPNGMPVDVTIWRRIGSPSLSPLRK
jgi:ferredoxin